MEGGSATRVSGRVPTTRARVFQSVTERDMNTKSSLPRQEFFAIDQPGDIPRGSGIHPAGSAAAEKPGPARGKRGSPRWPWTIPMPKPPRTLRTCPETACETLACHPDLICLPETFPYHRVEERKSTAEQAESLDGPIVNGSPISPARICWVICPLLTKEEGRIYNSAVVINRTGEIWGLITDPSHGGRSTAGNTWVRGSAGVPDGFRRDRHPDLL